MAIRWRDLKGAVAEMREGLGDGDPRMSKMLDILATIVAKVDEIDRSYLKERIGPHEP